MAPKRPGSKQQQQLNVDAYTLLKKPMEHLGKQLNVPGSFWQGRMSEDERDKIYKCTISVDCRLLAGPEGRTHILAQDGFQSSGDGHRRHGQPREQ